MTFSHLPAVLDEVEELAALFQAADRRLYLVGGIVRDLWLDRPVDDESDIDLTTDAIPAETKAIIADWADAVWLQGERFGTIGARRGGRSLEITTHRAEVYTPDSRKPEVAFGTDVDVDLSRRDFTVNAMAIDAAGGDLVDPFGGADDLAARRLRTPLDPEVSFADDPLRMLRAARFITRYELVPAPELFGAAEGLRDRLDIVSAERIRDEFEKFLGAATIDRGMSFLVQTGLLEQVLPDAEPASVAAGVELAQAVPPPWWLRLAALLYPLPGDAADALRAMRCSRETSATTQRVISGARFLESLDSGSAGVALDDAAIRRWIDLVGPHAEQSMALARAAGTDASVEHGWRDLASREDLSDFDPPISGPEIMEILGVEPGPVVGLALKEVRAHRIEHGPITSDQARQIVREWGDQHSGAAQQP